MNRPYTAHSPYSLTPTERIHSPREDSDETVVLGSEKEYGTVEDYEDYDAYDDDPIDRRWIWIAGVAGAILLVAVICTVVILGGGDSGSVSATVAAPATTSARASTSTAPSPTTPPSPTTSPAPPPAALPPETVTTLTPTESAPPTEAPTEVAPSPSTITYRVTGNRQLIDLVTVIYTDAQGALQTDVNVALPWSKTVVLDPGVELSSVTATSVGGQLNCSITDASGTALAAQNNNTMIATCMK